MRVLLVTGRLAEKLVRKYGEGADVLVVDIDVAAFITPKHLEEVDLSRYDLVLVPGLTAGNDWRSLEKKKGVKIRLGPIHAYDLKRVLKFVGEVEFSHEIPACRLINAAAIEEIRAEIERLEESCTFRLRDVAIGGDSRMKVVAEIARLSSVDEVERWIDRYADADVIDLGIPIEFDADFVNKAVKRLVDASPKPVSVDTFSKKAIEIGVKHGVDMVMSLSSENFDAIELLEDQAVVVVSRNVAELKKLVERAKKRAEKVIADPILDAPLRTAESILRYVEYRKLDSETPLLFGVGNVTELCDADSIGINALLAFIAEEIGCNLLFTTEASSKTVGSVRELKIATYLAKAAKLRNSPPKDAGFSLLVVKEKFRYPEPEAKVCVDAEESREFFRDPCGDFYIYIADGKIYCEHEKFVICGRRAKEILDTVLRHKLVSRLDHAAYLGRELMKAEIALRLGKNYVQDRDLDFGIY
ncbi:MAG: dihydropteroate synthase-like protein [Archaeoglobaceae archaeon]